MKKEEFVSLVFWLLFPFIFGAILAGVMVTSMWVFKTGGCLLGLTTYNC